MQNPFKPIKLPNSDEFTIHTNLSKQEILSKMKRLTKGLYTVSSFYFFKSEDPKFAGKINDDGFEIYLVRDVIGEDKPIFSPPMIKAKMVGENNTALQIAVEHTKLQRLFFSVFSRFALLCLLLWMLALPLGITFGIWENSQVNTATPSLETNKNSGVGTLSILAFYLAPLILIPIFFIHIPKYFAVRSMKRSKELLLAMYAKT